MLKIKFLAVVVQKLLPEQTDRQTHTQRPAWNYYLPRMANRGWPLLWKFWIRHMLWFLQKDAAKCWVWYHWILLVTQVLLLITFPMPKFLLWEVNLHYFEWTILSGQSFKQFLLLPHVHIDTGKQKPKHFARLLSQSNVDLSLFLSAIHFHVILIHSE